MKVIHIETEYIKLQDLLKFAAAVSTGGEAKILIQEGDVTVNGKKIRPGDDIALRDEHYTVTYAD